MDISKTTIVLAQEFSGVVQVLMRYHGFDSTTLVVRPLTEAFLVANGAKETKGLELLTFADESAAKTLLDNIGEAIKSGSVSVGTDYLDRERTAYYPLVPASLEVNASIDMHTQREFVLF